MLHSSFSTFYKCRVGGQKRLPGKQRQQMGSKCHKCQSQQSVPHAPPLACTHAQANNTRTYIHAYVNVRTYSAYQYKLTPTQAQRRANMHTNTHPRIHMHLNVFHAFLCKCIICCLRNTSTAAENAICQC